MIQKHWLLKQTRSGRFHRSLYYTATWDETRKSHTTLFKPHPGSDDQVDWQVRHRANLQDVLPPVVYRRACGLLRRVGFQRAAVMSAGGRQSEANRVFVYGALRSGTTVFRLMLTAHPRLKNPGEADFLFDYLYGDEAGEWHYDVEALAIDRVLRQQSLTIPQGLDGRALLENLLGQLDRKGDGLLTLNVHRHAAKILAALPGSRFIHLLRDPRDVARSSIGMG